MKLYNLTDLDIPGRGCNPQTLTKGGISISPGCFIEIPDNSHLGHISGWINTGKVSVNERPQWYVYEKTRQMDEEAKARREKHSNGFSTSEEVEDVILMEPEDEQ